MKKLVLVGIIAVLFSGCTVTSEKYQYKQRMDSFLNLLNDQEMTAFRAADYDTFGKLIDRRMADDNIFSNKFFSVQQSEAIATFDGRETGHFFRETLMREFNRPNFYRFMNILDSNSQITFARKVKNEEMTAQLYQNDKTFKAFIDNLRNGYCFYGFSNSQVVSFFRNTSFAETSRKELYYVLQILKECQALDEFKKGNIDASAGILTAALKKNPGIEMKFSKTKNLSGLSKIDSRAFLDIYHGIVMKEMDAGAVKKTLEKF